MITGWKFIGLRGGSGPDEYGFGLVKFQDFGIQLDFYLLEDLFPPRIETLFRANPDMFFISSSIL